MLSKSSKGDMDNSTLVLTQVIFRHGQRAPVAHFKYQGDPYVNEKFLPFGHGELTLNGRKQCYHLGQSLRERYAKLLGPEYYEGLIDAKSTERLRARTTLQLVLAGLFPPTAATKIDDQLNWQPIPFSYKPFNEDKLMGSAVINMRNTVGSPEFRKTQNSLDVIKCIKDELKWDVQFHSQCMQIFDTVHTQVGVGLPVPNWCADIFPDKLRKEHASFMQHNFQQKKYAIEGCGAFIQEINKIMTQKVMETENSEEEQVPKMFLYSGHDINLAGLLSIFQQFDAAKWPDYTANLSFELHLIDGEYYVKMLYHDGTKDARDFNDEQKLEVLTLPNFKDSLCKLSDFTEYVQDYFPEL